MSSADRVRITPAGIFAVEPGGDDEPEKLLPIENPICWLRRKCEIEPGTTVGALFEYVRRHKDLTGFLAQYTHCAGIEEWHAELDKPRLPRDYKSWEEMRRLGVGWVTEITEDHELFFWPNAGAVGPAREDSGEEDRKKGEALYSTFFMPMKVWARLPLFLDREVRIYDTRTTRKRSRRESAEPKLLLRAQREFSLLDVLGAIYWELGYFGSPQKTRRHGRRYLRKSTSSKGK